MTKVYGSFKNAQAALKSAFSMAPEVHAQKWQGRDVSERPEAKMIELLHESFRVQIVTEDLDHWRKDIPANYPWADDHFAERVRGQPINPGIEWANWPGGEVTSDFLDLDGDRFNHNYMERYWPKYAGTDDRPTQTAEEWGLNHQAMQDNQKGRSFGDLDYVGPHHGIRSEYGDLYDLVETLAKEPDTRQAYLPIYFPEDGTVKGRKPCTLGYHFILRHGYFHVTYYMRSCDFARHWADDCYLTLRLQLWIMDRCRDENPEIWNDVKPGFFNMHITSLHMFTNDIIPMGIKRR